MSHLKCNPLFKGLIALICVLSFTASAFCLLLLDSTGRMAPPFDREPFTESPEYRETAEEYLSLVRERYDLTQRLAKNGSLTYREQEALNTLEARLDPFNTNFRYRIRSDISGEVLAGNLTEAAALEELVSAVDHSVLTRYLTSDDRDEFRPDPDSGRELLVIQDGERFLTFDPAGYRHSYIPYGWFSDGEAWTEYSPARDQRVTVEELIIEYGTLIDLPMADGFREAQIRYLRYRDYSPYLLPASASFALLGLLCLLFLLRAAGHHRGREGISLSLQDRIPGDIYLALFLAAGVILIWYLEQVFFSLPDPISLAVLPAALFLFFALMTAFLVTFSARIKSRTLLKNTVIVRSCAFLARSIRRAAAAWPVTRRPVITFLLYLLGTALTTPTVIFILPYQGAALYGLCRWAKQWQAIREGTGRILRGDPEAQIDLQLEDKFIFRDLREHVMQLNDLGSSINTAVEERMRSERMKSELITNVSHDLKTPLTSIINYVDLLKKEDVEPAQAREYIEVLDRKSQRLKKLTEDLVEASKASTGALTVNRERIGITQLVQQALGEYEEKCLAAQLTPVVTLPEQELYVMADGRHLWRILDNLLGNCVKYTLEGTRIYLDVSPWEEQVILSVKNISREPLNIPPEQLMERFVRGDTARSSEGSGLGLSIARSLTELQGGTFRLDIDGDLFKASVILPQIR